MVCVLFIEQWLRNNMRLRELECICAKKRELEFEKVEGKLSTNFVNIDCDYDNAYSYETIIEQFEYNEFNLNRKVNDKYLNEELLTQPLDEKYTNKCYTQKFELYKDLYEKLLDVFYLKNLNQVYLISTLMYLR